VDIVWLTAGWARGVTVTTAQWVATASVAAVVVSAVAVAMALKGVRDQLRVSVFLTYTERYAKVMKAVPFEARRPGSDYRLASRPSDERTRVLEAFRDYFNLCSEEIWLHHHHRIDHSTWHVWERGMRQVARFPCFREAWEELAVEYNYYDVFLTFVNDKLMPPAATADLDQSDARDVATTQP
jgi:hypothetical protein